jgi:hypothetical protein
VEGRDLSSRQMQDVAKDMEIGKPHMGSFGSRAYSFGHVSNSEGCFGIRGPSPIA